MLFEMISLKYDAKPYNELLIDETIILNGNSFLWIFYESGRSYALGSGASLDLNRKNSFFDKINIF